MNSYPLTQLQEDVLSLIRERKHDNPIAGHQIIKLAGVIDKDKKTGANLRSVINSLRDKGYAICANGRGYYYPSSPQELEEYINNFQNRIDQQQQACNTLRERLNYWVEWLNQKRKEEEQKTKQEKLF